MPTFGSTSTPGSTWDWSGSNTETQLAKYLGTMPEDGYVNEIFFYAAGYTTTPVAQGVLWDGNGNVICAGAQVTLPLKGGGVGAQQWNGSGGLSHFVAAGTALYAGWWRDPSKDCAWSLGSGSSLATSDSIDSPHTLSGDFGLSGAIGAYISYTPANPPIIATQAASGLSGSGAQLNGQVNPNGLDTTWYFEYGLTTGYGSQIPATPVDAGSGTSAVAVDEVLSGLSPGTWHFQLVATNAAGTVYGGDQAFVIGGTGSGHLSFAGTGQPPVPVVTVTAPAGTNESANPTVQWTVALPGGLKAASWRCIVYTKAQVAAGGFTPGLSGSAWDSGVVAGSALSAAPTGLGNFGTYYAYVQVTSSMGTASAWAFISWVQAVGLVGVEIGFQPTAGLGNNFVLGSATQGVLGGAAGLGGTIFVDVTRYCSGHISIRRGRSRPTDQYTAGEAQVTLRNEDRRFDPLNTSSPYYPGIIPRAPLNIYVGGIQVFGGFIDDYNPGWEKPATSTVPVTAHDAFALLACAYINDWEAPSELSGTRILDILDNNFPGFPAPVNVAEGNTLLQENLFGANSKGSLGDIVLNDMQTAANSEWGFFFVARDGTLTFLDRYAIIRQLAASVANSYDALVLSLAPTAWWKLADPVGSGTAADSSGNGYTGTVNGGVTFGQPGPIAGAPQDTAALFDGTSGYIETSGNGPTLATEFSFAAWHYASGPSPGSPDLFSERSGGDAVGLIVNAAAAGISYGGSVDNSNNSYFYESAQRPYGWWYFVVYTYSSTGGGILYVNGVQSTTQAVTGANTLVAPLANLGYVSQKLTGKAGELAIFPYALSAAQVAALYEASPLGPAVAATFSDLSADWADGAFPYYAISAASAVLLLYNEVQGTRSADQLLPSDSPGTQIAEDLASQQAYYLRSLQLPQLENWSDQDVLNLCNWVLSLYSEPEVRFDTVTLELTGMDVAQLQQLASLDMTDLCTVKRTPGGGTPATIDLLSFIDQINYELDVSGSTYRLSLSFGSAELQNYFVLNNPTYGVLGTSELAY